MKFTIVPFHLFVALSFIFLGCEKAKILATGAEDEIVVFADSTTWHALQQQLRETFEDTVYTPQPERWFTLRWVSFDRFDEFLTHKNRLIVAPLNDSGQVAQYMRASLDTSVQVLVQQGKEFYFSKYDVYARRQIVMYLTGPTLDFIRASVASRGPDLLYYFTNMALKRELASLENESRYNKRDVEEELAKKYGWTMTVQHDYAVAIDSASARFFWMRRATPSDMERWIFVHWIESATPQQLTEGFVLSLRDSLTRLFLRTIDDDAHVEIAPYNLRMQQVNFLGRFAFETRGNWRFSDKTGGGPFVNYTFYDEPTRRIYMLDGSIFAPRVEKKKLVLQVDGLLHTFRTSQEISPQQTSSYD
ncbi:MAG TPA: DUF4837 family protein [Bacteroidota bacterium]|nr:DUF4837 family protein [Bacteroidota bacterium]